MRHRIYSGWLQEQMVGGGRGDKRHKREEKQTRRKVMCQMSGPIMNKGEEMGNESKCDEIDECLEELGTFVCDNLCCHNRKICYRKNWTGSVVVAKSSILRIKSGKNA